MTITPRSNRRLLDAFATQAAMAMERVQLLPAGRAGPDLQARENLERALLNSISHDLRTPLVSITGSSPACRDEGAHLSDAGPARAAGHRLRARRSA